MIQTDSELLSRVGLSFTEAAQFLYRSRQAVCQALGRNDQYFKPCDWLTLRLAADAKARDPAAAATHLDLISEYVSRHWGDAAAEQVRTGYGQMQATLDPSAYEELWVLVPDVGYLTANLPDQAAFLRALPRLAPDATIVYAFSSGFERRAYLTKVESGGIERGQIIYIDDAMIAAQFTMLIGDPKGAPDFWVLSQSGFQRAVSSSPEITALHLQDLAPVLANAAASGEG